MRRSQPKKAHLNLSINPDILEMFDSLEPIHKREYSEFVEEKLMELINQLAPDMVMERKIKEMRETLSELETSYPGIKYTYKNLRKRELEESKKVHGGEEKVAELENVREDMFKKYLPTLTYQVNNRISHDWSKLQVDFRFKSKAETQDYIMGRLVSQGVIA